MYCVFLFFFCFRFITRLAGIITQGYRGGTLNLAAIGTVFGGSVFGEMATLEANSSYVICFVYFVFVLSFYFCFVYERLFCDFLFFVIEKRVNCSPPTSDNLSSKLQESPMKKLYTGAPTGFGLFSKKLFAEAQQQRIQIVPSVNLSSIQKDLEAIKQSRENSVGARSTGSRAEREIAALSGGERLIFEELNKSKVEASVPAKEARKLSGEANVLLLHKYDKGFLNEFHKKTFDDDNIKYKAAGELNDKQIANLDDGRIKLDKEYDDKAVAERNAGLILLDKMDDCPKSSPGITTFYKDKQNWSKRAMDIVFSAAVAEKKGGATPAELAELLSHNLYFCYIFIFFFIFLYFYTLHQWCKFEFYTFLYFYKFLQLHFLLLFVFFVIITANRY